MLKRRAEARKILGAASIAFVTYLAQGAWATTVYVDISGLYWPSAYRFIQHGIDAASDGDTVQVMSSGAYAENIHFHGKNIVVTGIGPTVIHGRGDGPTVTFAGTEGQTCVLQGFIIQGGIADYGGGICGGDEDNHTHATIANNVIAGNQATWGGGIAYCDGVIRGNTIVQNYAVSAGGGLSDCGGTILSNTIASNSAAYSGGGLNDCNARILNNTIATNHSATKGGGLYNCDGLIQNNTIGGNSAGEDGGGLAYCSDGTIKDNTISGNSAAGDLGGGGLYLCSTIQNNTITGNSADREGGGLRTCNTIQSNIIAGNSAGSSGGGLSRCHTIRNNTIADNSATQSGGGLYECSSISSNCILWGNTAGNGPQLYQLAVPEYSCIEGWTGDPFKRNISEDPQFVDPDGPDNDPKTYEDNNYRLSYGSPCIDEGSNSALGTPPGLDLDSNLRVVMGRRSLTVDMGAYEYNSGPIEIQAILRFGASAVQLMWRSQPNDTYTVWSRADLLTGTWIEEGTVPSHGAETPWIDAAAGGHMKFYRVEMK